MSDSPDNDLQKRVRAALRNGQVPATNVLEHGTVNGMRATEHYNEAPKDGLSTPIQGFVPSLRLDPNTATEGGMGHYPAVPATNQLQINVSELSDDSQRQSLSRSPTFLYTAMGENMLPHQQPLSPNLDELQSDECSDVPDSATLLSTPQTSADPLEFNSSPRTYPHLPTNYDSDIRAVGGAAALPGLEVAYPPSIGGDSAHDSHHDSSMEKSHAERPYTSNLGLPDQWEQGHVSELSVVSDAGDQQHKRQQRAKAHVEEEDQLLEQSESFPTPNDRYELQSEIFDALVDIQNANIHHTDAGFLPKAQLRRLVTPISVFRELTKEMSHIEVKTRKNVILKAAYDVCRESDVMHHGRRKIKTFRKIFALLVLTDIASLSLILRFMKEDVSDLDLPLVGFGNRRNWELRRRDDAGAPSSAPLRCFKHHRWSPNKLRDFERHQWKMLAPFFSQGTGGDVKHYPLLDQHILPFVAPQSDEEELADSFGGFATVFMVRIHEDHHNFPDTFSCQRGFAIKQLNANDRKAFKKEETILKKFSGDRSHPHIVSLLATYEHLRKFHLIFYRAEGDLFHYWQTMDAAPPSNAESTTWMAKQCAGLADGLLRLHKHLTFGRAAPRVETEEELVARTSATGRRSRVRVAFQRDRADVRQPSEESDRPQSPSWMLEPQRTDSDRQATRSQKLPKDDLVQQEKFGRHGDISPGNILFYDDSEPIEGRLNGTLKISDFGQAEINSRFSKSKPCTVANTLTYRPPECDLKPKIIRQSYDIWCLGCVYLEFVTWMLGGYELVLHFAHKRSSRDVFQAMQITDTFFQVVVNEDRNHTGVMVKPAVTEFIHKLHEHERCTEYFHDLLNMIQHDMIVVESNKRKTCQYISQKLQLWHQKCLDDRAYAENSSRWNSYDWPAKPSMRSVDVEVGGDAGKIIEENRNWLPVHSGRSDEGCDAFK